MIFLWPPARGVGKISSEDEKCPSSEIIVEMSSEDYYQKMPYYQRPSLEYSKLHNKIVYRYILWTRHLETLE